MLRGLLVVLGLGLTLYALIDCIRTDESDVKGLPKPLWVLVIVLVTIVGPLAWLLAGKQRALPGPVRPSRPVAPDDDPEFLRQLEAQRRRRADDERLQAWEDEMRRREDNGNGPDDADRRP